MVHASPRSSASRKPSSTPTNQKPHIEFDSASLNPHYSYVDEQNHTHQVWFLDAVTAYNELRASERLGVQGTALWRFGSGDSSIWPIWDATRPDHASAR
jgi:spore germination protein YaaH